jgi:Lrp/AsnC family leucine-responsive transcriptional regulator
MPNTRKPELRPPQSPSKPAAAEPAPVVDQFDWRILAAVLDNGRMTNVEIARRVGLSEAPCSRRIKRLEHEGIIRGYTALLDLNAVGIGFTAYVTLVLDYVTAATADEFAEKIRAIPEIISCYIVSGSYDAILYVAARDAKAYSDIVFDQLRRIPGVKDVRSSFIMRTIKEDRGIRVPVTE